MPEEQTIRELLSELCPIAVQLIAVVNTAKKAFIHQRLQLLTQLNNQQDPLCREIGSALLKLNELRAEKSVSKREPYLSLIGILTHFQIIAEATGRLENTLRKQISDGVLFSDKAVSQINSIFDQQIEIISCLADVIRKDGIDICSRAINECNELAQSCIRFATEHETRLVEGLCFPQAAPLFLAILDQVQTIVHHEREIAELLDSDYEWELIHPSEKENEDVSGFFNSI